MLRSQFAAKPETTIGYLIIHSVTYFDSIKSILTQMQCRIRFNKKSKNDKWRFWASESHMITGC